MIAGTDYAFAPHPSPDALKAAGVRFVMRYISSYLPNDSNGKNLLGSELAALLAAGLEVGVVAEEVAGTGGGWMLGGYGAGQASARHAEAVVTTLRMPGIPVYFAADFDASPAQQAAIDACLDGAASVLGRDRTGIYGSYYVVQRALDAGKAAWAWQTIAWSGGQWDSRACLRQGLARTIGGVQCDEDTAMTADFGQWPRPAPVPSPVQEDDMPSGTIPSTEASWNAVWPAGSCTWAAFGAGPPMTGKAGQPVRVSLHSRAKGWSQQVTFDAIGKKEVVTFTEKDVDEMGIERTDPVAANWTPVAYNAG